MKRVQYSPSNQLFVIVNYAVLNGDLQKLVVSSLVEMLIKQKNISVLFVFNACFDTHELFGKSGTYFNKIKFKKLDKYVVGKECQMQHCKGSGWRRLTNSMEWTPKGKETHSPKPAIP